MDDRYIQVGRIVATHGIRGEVKVVLLSNNFDRFSKYKEVLISDLRNHLFLSKLESSREKKLDDDNLYIVEQVRNHKGSALVKFKGLDDIDSASNLISKQISVKKSDLEVLPQGNYYHFQLLGLDCESTDGQHLGIVKEVLDLPANDVLVIRQDRKLGGGEFMVPMVKDFVREIDLESKKLVIEDRKGLR